MGTFRCTYTPQFAGQYKIAVKQAKLHITGSPFAVRVLASEAVPAHCTAYGRGGAVHVDAS